MVGPIALGDQACPAHLVEAALLEADREGAQRFARLGRGQGGDAAGVDPTGEQHANRHVGDQMGADRVAEDVAQLRRELVDAALADLVGRNRLRPGVAADRDLPSRQLSR